MINEEFEKASPEQKRVMIAKDVLHSIQIGMYSPQKGVYISRSYFRENFVNDVQLQDVLLNEVVKDCMVCALGSCFLSIVKFTNNLTVGETSKTDFTSASNYRGIRGRSDLEKYFGKRQLGLIESAFECSPSYAVNEGVNRDQAYAAAFEFGENCSNSTEKLIAIMNNIIKNNGEFVPEELEQENAEESTKELSSLQGE